MLSEVPCTVAESILVFGLDKLVNLEHRDFPVSLCCEIILFVGKLEAGGRKHFQSL